MKILEWLTKLCCNMLLLGGLVAISVIAFMVLKICFAVGGILSMAFGALTIVAWAYAGLCILSRMCGFAINSKTSTEDTMELNDDDIMSCVCGDYIANNITKGGR